MSEFQQFRTDSFSVEEGVLGLLVGAAAVDGDIHAEEMREISALANRTKTLGPVTPDDFHRMKERVFAILRDRGIVELFKASALAIPAELREPAFAAACDILFADGHVTEAETKYKELMCAVLEVDMNRAQTIVSVMAIKNRA
jgi:prepilin-type processing-associated H-X9-DG protein